MGLYRMFYILNWIYKWLVEQHIEWIAVVGGRALMGE